MKEEPERKAPQESEDGWQNQRKDRQWLPVIQLSADHTPLVKI